MPRRCPTTGKTSYSHYTHAAAAAHHLGKAHLKTLRFYRCPFCHKWHLTSTTKKPNQPRITPPPQE